MDEATVKKMAAAVAAVVTASRDGVGTGRASALPAAMEGIAATRRIDAELWARIEAGREVLT